jgi:hypothetical protein
MTVRSWVRRYSFDFLARVSLSRRFVGVPAVDEHGRYAFAVAVGHNAEIAARVTLALCGR